MDLGLRLAELRSGWICLRDDIPREPREGTELPAVVFEAVTNLRDATRFKAVFAVSAPEAGHLWGAIGQLVHDNVRAWIVTDGVTKAVVGTILLFTEGRIASAHMLTVLPAWRKRGMGEAILREAVRSAFAFHPTVDRVDLEMMPAAHHIPERLGAHELLRFGGWRKR